MNRDTVRTRLISILTSKDFGSLQVDVSDLSEDTSLINEIALDSLQLLEFIVAIENSFSFQVKTNRLNVDIFDRFGDVIDFVQENLSPTWNSGVLNGQSA